MIAEKKYPRSRPASHGSPAWWLACAAALAALALAIPPAHAADDTTVSAAFSQDVIPLGSVVDYQIVLRSTSGIPSARQINIVRMPRFSGLRARGGPATASRSQIINGAMDASVTLTWQLLADQPGEAAASEGEIEYRGKPYRLEPRTLRVVKDADSALPDGVRDGSVLAPQTEYDTLNKQLRGKIFARLVLSNASPWMEETITASCFVYLDESIRDAVGDVGWQTPPWGDFFAEEVPLGNLSLRPMEYGGRRYLGVEIARFYLTATRAGEMQIPLTEARCSVRIQDSRRPRSFHDSFFDFGFDPFGSANRVPVRLPVAAAAIHVKPLPTEGRPPSFQGAVGHFSVTGGVDRREMSQDDILTLRLEVGGEGYLGSIAQPRIDDSADWRIVDRQVKIDSPKLGKDTPPTSAMGKKIFEFLMRPQRTGKLPVPRVAYAYFDPTQNRYIEEVVGPFEIAVAKGRNQQLVVSGNTSALPTPSAGATASTAPAVYGEQLAYIRTSAPASAWAAPLYRRPWFLALQALPLLVLAIAAGGRLWRKYRETHADALRYRAAGARARRELGEARDALRKEDPTAFWRALGDALRRYIATKTGRAEAGITLDEVEEACRKRGADDATAREARAIIERCDQARYMASPPRQGMAEALEATSALLRRLDKVFR